MDEDFRIPLERRIASLRGHRDLLQEDLRDAHSELNSVERRIEVAEELYRQEFGAEPTDATAAVHARRATRIRRANAGQLPWREAVVGVLERAGRPLHARDIWRNLQESGFQSDAADPIRSVVAIAIRTEGRIHRVAPNTFALNGIDHDERQLRVDSGADALVPTHEGEEH